MPVSKGEAETVASYFETRAAPAPQHEDWTHNSG